MDSLLLLCPLPGDMFWHDHFSFRPTQFCVDLSYSFGCISLSASLYLVIAGSCSTCRCILIMFVGSGEFCILCSTMLLFVFPFMFVNTWFMYVDASVLEAYIFTMLNLVGLIPLSLGNIIVSC